MRKLWAVGLFAFLAVALAAPLWAADEGDQKWHVHGDIRARGDYFENLSDYLDAQHGGLADNFGIWPFTVKLSLDGQLADNVHGFVELRNDETFGAAPTLNELPFSQGGGVDPRFFADVNSSDTIHLYQAYVDLNKIGDTNFSVRIGRQEHTLGTELLMGDNDFYTGQSFDGARLMWNHDKWDLNLFYYKVFESNFAFGTAPTPILLSGSSSDVNFFGATFDWKFDPKWGQLDVYYLRYQSLDPGTPGAPIPGVTLFANAGIDTYGARWGKLLDPKSNDFLDWNIEYASQTGDFGPLAAQIKQSANVVEGWFGINFHPGVHHRVHVGYLAASGDKTSTATKNEAFFPLFNDNHAYNRLGNLDNFAVSDIVDINAGYDVWFGHDQRHWIMAAIHKLKLEQSLGNGHDNLGTIWDVGYGYMMTKNVSFEVGASQSKPSDVQDDLPPPRASSDTAARYYGQVRLRW